MSAHNEDALLEQYEGLLEEDMRRYMTKADCFRFLRARKWHVNKAIEMTRTWWVWYNAPIDGTENICPRNILDTLEDPHEEVYKDLMPHSNFGFSLDGCPVYWERTGQISARFGEISKLLTLDDLVIRHIRQQEMAVRRMQFYNEQNPSAAVEQQIVVFNLADMSYALDTTALAAFRKTLQIDQDYYPERLHTLFMINAPWFFTALWAVVKIGIDPVTANKIRIVGSSYISSLREIVADEHIPVELGGSCEDITWEWPFPEKTGCSAATLKLPFKNELKYAASCEDSKLSVSADVMDTTVASEESSSEQVVA